MKYIIFFTFFAVSLKTYGQPNCYAFKYFGDTLKYKACIKAEERYGHYQFSKEYQQALDQSLAIDSTFAYAYRAKSTAYLKSGDFINWKLLMDKAVSLEPENFLAYRGWCRFQFFRDYKGAIDDIERLNTLVENPGYSVNGDYHLSIAKALCYKGIGKHDIAIQIIEKQLKKKGYLVGIYDYLHLGVLYYEKGDYKRAITILKLQEQENDLAENRYYIGLCYKKINEVRQYVENIKMSKEKYLKGSKMFDPYVEQMDKIYLSEIEEQIKLSEERDFNKL